MLSFHTVADNNGCLRGIPFDKKNSKTWKFAAETVLDVTGALDIARGRIFCDTFAVKRN